MTNEARGQFAVLKVEQRAVERGFIVSRPSVPARYDLIIDCGDRLERVQVKYANGLSQHSSGVSVVDLRKRGKIYSRSEIDIVAVYVAPVNRVCWFPVAVFEGRTVLYVRFATSRNGQRKGCLYVEDFAW